MKKRRLFLMLGMAAMLASCSQEELGGTRADGAMTITATVDNGIGTRASTYDTDDVTIDRCLLEVYDQDGSLVGQQLTGTPGAQEGTFTFTVSGLDPDAKYDFLFWADNNAAAAYDGSLKERKLNAAANLAEALAFQGKIEGSTPAAATSVTLTHAVAKVTLNTTGAMDAGDKVTLGISGVTGTWDVSAGTATGTVSTEYAYTLASAIAQPQDRTEVTTFYVPAPAIGSTNDVTIVYASADNARTGSANITNVPLKANFRTVLTGDVAALYEGATASITAALDEDWNDQDGETIFTETNVITTTGVGQITEEAVRKALEIGEGTVIIKGPISTVDLNIIAAIMDTEMNIDLSQATLMNNDGTEPLTTFPDSFRMKSYGDDSNMLVSIILPQGIEALPDNCFYRNKMLTSITLPEGLKTIGKLAFSESGLTSIDLPESLETIGESAFHLISQLESVTIPEGVTSVGKTCFSDCGLKHVVWNASCDIVRSVFSYNDGLETVTLNKCGAIDKMAFARSTIQEMTVNIDTPPTFEVYKDGVNIVNKPDIKKIYVPAAAVETYKATPDWSEYANVISAIE